jgi:hypothetical protein
MNHLALKIGDVHGVEVDESDRPNPRCSEIERCR